MEQLLFKMNFIKKRETDRETLSTLNLTLDMLITGKIYYLMLIKMQCV
jgi:hypothetical protein